MDTADGPLTARRVVLAIGASDRLAVCCGNAKGSGLAWTAGLFAVGLLGELELGPTARTIAGARSAARRPIDRNED